MANEDRGNGAQNIVAQHVPELVVDLLEVIEIDHEDADAAAIAGGAGDLIDQAGLEIAAIEYPGESVAICELTNPVDIAGVLGRRGQNVGDGFERLNVIGEECFVLRADTDQQSDIFAKGDQRQADLLAAGGEAASRALRGIAAIRIVRSHARGAGVALGQHVAQP